MASLALAFDILARDRNASRTFDKVGRSAANAGRQGGKFGGSIRSAMGVAATAAGVGSAVIVAGIGAAINKAMDYDKTMRLVGATLGTTGEQQQRLSALAIKMGADTVFSAKDAGDAMLELAKGGMKAAQIEGGALAATMTLAAAGGLEMGAAATYVGNALNTFGLGAKEASSVAAALAGGANASSASVESLGMALGQVGPGAKTAGLSIQTTTGILAAFDNAGIKGSDAGTSLKTMLTRLVPATNKARNAMKDLGLRFTDSKGAFLPMRDVAQQLQDKLKSLTDEQRTTALSTIFGSDATRAATVLMDLGSKGVDRYTKATSDQAAAQRMAKTQTEGAAGAWEAFKGSLETLAITAGVKLLPAFTSVVKGLTSIVNTISVKAGPVIQSLIGWIGGQLWPALQKGYQTIMPALQNALSIVTGGLGEGGTGGAFRKLGDILVTKVIPIVSKIISVWLPYMAAQIRVVIEVVKFLWRAFETLMSIVGRVVSFILKGFSDMTSMWAGVLRALAKVPGFGWAKDAADKLDGAATKAGDLARSIDNIDRNVEVKVKVSGSGQVTLPGGTKVDFGQYRARAKGGSVHPGTLYQVGDNADGSWNSTTEVLAPTRPMRVLNQEQMKQQLGGAAAPTSSGAVTLSESSLHRLAQILSGVTLKPVIGRGDMDAALAAGLN